MATQPYYHRCTLLFTSTSGTLGEFETRIREALEKSKTYVKDSLIVEEHESEAGDPADL